MELLRNTVGLTPQDILKADKADLARAGRMGILPDSSAGKLVKAARIAMDEFGGDVRGILGLPIAQARTTLRKFPSIGEPGAEMILLLCHRAAFLAPESNGLRVLERLGFCDPEASYAVRYKQVRTAVEQGLEADLDILIEARYALRSHGMQICRNKDPKCGQCPLATECPSAEL